MRVAVVMALALSAVIVAVLATALLTRPQDKTPACTEDMPCWNCTTMGNRICGSTS